MKSKFVVALPKVEADILSAISHYCSWRSDGEENFLKKYEETISWIEWNPDSFPTIYGRVQRAILKNSYYIVYFIQEHDRTIVLAVLDGRRSPKIIRRVVRNRASS